MSGLAVRWAGSRVGRSFNNCAVRFVGVGRQPALVSLVRARVARHHRFRCERKRRVWLPILADTHTHTHTQDRGLAHSKARAPVAFDQVIAHSHTFATSGGRAHTHYSRLFLLLPRRRLLLRQCWGRRTFGAIARWRNIACVCVIEVVIVDVDGASYGRKYIQNFCRESVVCFDARCVCVSVCVSVCVCEYVLWKVCCEFSRVMVVVFFLPSCPWFHVPHATIRRTVVVYLGYVCACVCLVYIYLGHIQTFTERACHIVCKFVVFFSRGPSSRRLVVFALCALCCHAECVSEIGHHFSS